MERRLGVGTVWIGCDLMIDGCWVEEWGKARRIRGLCTDLDGGTVGEGIGVRHAELDDVRYLVVKDRDRALRRVEVRVARAYERDERALAALLERGERRADGDGLDDRALGRFRRRRGRSLNHRRDGARVAAAGRGGARRRGRRLREEPRGGCDGSGHGDDDDEAARRVARSARDRSLAHQDLDRCRPPQSDPDPPDTSWSYDLLVTDLALYSTAIKLHGCLARG